MAMKKKATRKAITKSKAAKLPEEQRYPTTWVDRVMEDWVDVVEPDSTTTASSSPMDRDDGVASAPAETTLSVGMVCWNVLADSYCSRRSHRHLPLVYQNHVFDRQKRQNHIRQILKRL
jgi:hypothetical protein